MATVLFDGILEKDQDWGDPKGNGQPASGRAVQQFIKDTLNKKFGYLDYHRDISQYYVFADHADAVDYNRDPITYADLLLAQFDAPAPYELQTPTYSNTNVTTLLSSKNNVISFRYFILDKAKNPNMDDLSIRMSISTSSSVKVAPLIRGAHTDDWNVKGDGDTYIGSLVEIPIDEYLTSEDTYTFTLTLTGVNTKAMASLTFEYKVVNLDVDVVFNEDSIPYYPFDNNESFLPAKIMYNGALGQNKIIDIFIDGEELKQTGLGYEASQTISSGDVIGSQLSETKNIRFYNKDNSAAHNAVVWPETVKNTSLRGKQIFSEGKHTLQVRIKIPKGVNEYFYSKSKYFEFIVVNSEELKDETYLLYVTDINPSDNEAVESSIRELDSDIILSGEQYNSVSMSVIPINTKNNNVNIIYNIIGRTNEENTSILHGKRGGEIDNFNYIFNSIDVYDLNIYTNNTNGDPKLHAEITITGTTEFGTIEEQDIDNLLVKYTALNRSNSELSKDSWKNSAPRSKGVESEEYPVIFHNVLWNDQCGWDGQALVLRNNAYIEIPIQLFDLYGSTGLTFEIDFETFDVRDDDAVILDFSDPNNKSYLRFTATKAETLSKNNVSVLKTNYKDGSRNKIAFCYNPTSDNKNEPGVPNPNLILIFVNGVLDRACKWGAGTKNSDTMKWDSPTTNTITIGNSEGIANMKIYGIRIYGTCYTTEQAFMNYVVDQGENIPTIMRKNNVLGENGKISFQTILNNGDIPIFLLSTDYNDLNNATNKKDHAPFDGQFFAGSEHPELGFYVRNGYVSLQGTSSMNYPTKNLRPYFNKVHKENVNIPLSLLNLPYVQDLNKQNGIDLDNSYRTEFWPYSEYAGHNEVDFSQYIDTEGIIPYSVSSKGLVGNADEVTADAMGASNLFHEIAYGKAYSYRADVAKKYAAKGEKIYAGTLNAKGKSLGMQILNPKKGQTIDQLIDAAIAAGQTLCISAYRPLRRTNMTDDEYWFYIKQLRYSGVKTFSCEAVKDDETGETVNYAFKNEKKGLKQTTEYYGLGAFWRQYNTENHYSTWTDRWTVKADFAESSMTHNGGIGALWGRVLRTFMYNGERAGETGVQACPGQQIPGGTGNNKILANEFVDIRTSCDSKPIIIFTRKPTAVDSNGVITYSDPEYAGIFIIMTDKSSIPAFGFKDIKDQDGNLAFNAQKVECWEFSQNGSDVATGVSLIYNDAENEVTLTNGATKDKNGYNIGEGRPIFDIFESRWPECGGDKSATEGDELFYQDDVIGSPTNNLETFLRWLHFCEGAIDYTIDGQDGYQYSPYIPFASSAEAAAWKASHTGEEAVLYYQWEDSGNIKYTREGEPYKTGGKHTDTDEEGNTTIVWEEEIFVFDPAKEGLPIYRYDVNADLENVVKSRSARKIKDTFGDVYKLKIEGFDALNRCFIQNEDGTYSNSIDEDKAANYLVEVYLRKEGSRYMYESDYTDAWVQCTSARIADITDNDHINISGKPYEQLTFMDYFEATAPDHLDVPKVAAYYIYIMRFGAVDQCVKNCMITTEDGQHWYFINYDNDTVLGVRNDATLIFNWDFDRNTYDYDGNNYAFAGARAILWNNIEQSDYFMNIVKAIAQVFYTSGLLTKEAVLKYLDETMCGTWCERLYNAQEEIKYLSTFKRKFDGKYLKFVQGTRKSHRNWWVNNRWELYDSIWNMGSFANKYFTHYIVCTDGAKTTNPIEFLRITAASKYNFKLIKNTQPYGTLPARELIPLNRDESFSFNMYADLQLGDPIKVWGPHKMKVVNYRPGTRYLTSAFELVPGYTINVADPNNPEQLIEQDSDWVLEAGTYMVKLLIGDGTNTCSVSSIDGLNSVTSLEDIDLRGCTNLAPIAMNKLINVHRFRSTNSTVYNFMPADGVVLYEVSLTSNLESISLVNVIFEEQKPEDYPVYQTENPIRNGVMINDALPYGINSEGKLTGAYSGKDDDVYKYTSESKAIFDYKPTRTLKSVTFDNVQGFDTLQFIRDLKEATPVTQLPNTILTLRSINWSGITVSELIELYLGKDSENNKKPTFRFDEFSGIIKVVSDEIDPNTGEHNTSITFDEYNRIKKEFGEEVFGSDENQKLRITTEKNTFFTPTDDTKQVILESYADNSTMFTFIKTNIGKDVYQVIRGDEFKVKATIFPIDNTVTYKYALTKLNGSNPQQIPAKAGSNNNVFEEVIAGTVNVTLTNYENGTAVLKFAEGRLINNTNTIYVISVVKENEDGELVDYDPNMIYQKDTPNIYVGSVARIMPSEIPAKFDNGAGIVSTINISDEDHHIIEFDLGETTNASLKDFTISNVNEENIVFDKKENGKYDYTLENNKLTIGFSSIIPKNDTSINAKFTFTFETTDQLVLNQNNNRKDSTLTINLKTIYADEVKLVLINELGELDETNVIDSVNNKLTINKPGNYKYKLIIGPENYNIELTPSSITSSIKYGQTTGAFRVQVPNNFDENNEIEFNINGLDDSNNYASLAAVHQISMDFNHKYNDVHEPIHFEFIIETKIIYPESTYISVQDYLTNKPNQYITGKTDNIIDIYLLNNKGTRGADSSSTYLPLLTDDHGNNTGSLNVKLNVHDLANASDFDNAQPTVDYYFNFANDITITTKTDSMAHRLIGDDAIIKCTVKDSGNGHGRDTLELSIQAIENNVFTVNIKGTYSIRFDDDFDSSTPEQTNNIPFEVNINYTLASYNSYDAIGNDKWYLVDKHANLYSVDPDEILDPDSSSSMLIEIAKGFPGEIEFIGVGHTYDVTSSSRKYLFVALVKESDKDIYTSTKVPPFASRMFFPENSSNCCLKYYNEANKGLSNDGVWKNGTTDLFKGNCNTTEWINQLYESLNGNQEIRKTLYDSTLYKIYFNLNGKLDYNCDDNKSFEVNEATRNMSSIKPYIPIAAELTNIIKERNKFDNIINTINNIYNINNDFDKFLTINDFKKAIVNPDDLFSASTTQDTLYVGTSAINNTNVSSGGQGVNSDNVFVFINSSVNTMPSFDGSKIFISRYFMSNSSDDILSVTSGDPYAAFEKQVYNKSYIVKEDVDSQSATWSKYFNWRISILPLLKLS